MQNHEFWIFLERIIDRFVDFRHLPTDRRWSPEIAGGNAAHVRDIEGTESAALPSEDQCAPDVETHIPAYLLDA
jgi:hypothetical protein